jgi:hypothetical protein
MDEKTSPPASKRQLARPRRPRVFIFQCSEAERVEIKALADKLGCSQSDAVRLAIRQYARQA